MFVCEFDLPHEFILLPSELRGDGLLVLNGLLELELLVLPVQHFGFFALGVQILLPHPDIASDHLLLIILAIFINN